MNNLKYNIFTEYKNIIKIMSTIIKYIYIP